MNIISTQFGYVNLAFHNNKLANLQFQNDLYWSKIEKTFFNNEFDSELLTKVVNSIETGKLDSSIEFHLQGTQFQQQVWNQLIKVPFGSTTSYQQLANQINKPSAVRAVANACAKNPIAVLIPCHRVIRSSGKLGGYHWGVELKIKLLKRENIKF